MFKIFIYNLFIDHIKIYIDTFARLFTIMHRTIFYNCCKLNSLWNISFLYKSQNEGEEIVENMRQLYTDISHSLC